MKASEMIKQMQSIINIHGDTEVVIPEYIEENTTSTYCKYVTYNNVKSVGIGNDTNKCLCIQLRM